MQIFDFLDKYLIKYNDKDLILHAFMHSSYLNEHKQVGYNNERLEFMGDAVLQIYTADRLYKIEPKLKEGHMSPMRANLVCEKSLAKYAIKYNLNNYLLLGSGEEKLGGRHKESIIADMFEAFIGAIYLDTDILNVFKLLDIVMLEYVNNQDIFEIDPKTRLQEYIQSDNSRSLKYILVSSEGPSNSPIFTVDVTIDEMRYGTGKGKTKKEAEKNAAFDALRKLKGD